MVVRSAVLCAALLRAQVCNPNPELLTEGVAKYAC